MGSSPGSTSDTGPPLRVGLLLDSLVVRAWVARVIEEVEAAPWAEIALVVLNDSAPPRPGLLRRLWRGRRHLLYRAYARLDRRLMRSQPDPFAAVDLEPLLGDRPLVPVVPRRTRYSDFFPEASLEEIGRHRLDVALRFGFRILRGEVLSIARYGVWSHHHGDDREQRGGPPGFWEVVAGKPVTGSVLQVLTEELDAGRVIYRSYAPTHRRSVERSRHHLYWKTAAFVPRTLERLHELGPRALELAAVDEPRPDSGRIFRKPGNLEFLRHFPGFALRAGGDKAAELLTRSQWLLAFALPAPEVLDAAALRSFRPLLPPADRYWADPFPVRHRDKYFVFVEEYLYRAGRGRVAVLEIDAQGTVSRPAAVLETAHHLSYPFVFVWRGEHWMIPESGQKGTVELYRSRSFPGDWELEAVLLEGVRAVDATLHQDGPDWWMFVNLAPPNAAHPHDELHLFHADSPLGPWRPHARNPVKSDTRSARPAGRLFTREGRLYRPAQDCSGRYGRAIAVNEVLRLDSGEYAERVVTRIEPSWRRGLLATHTLNREGELAVVDGMRRIRRLGGWPGARAGSA